MAAGEWNGLDGWGTRGRKGQVTRGTAAEALSFPSAYTNTHTSPNLESVSHAGGKEGRRLSQWEWETWQRETQGTHALTQEKQAH